MPLSSTRLLPWRTIVLSLLLCASVPAVVSALTASMPTATTDHHNFLLPHLHKAFPTVQSYQILHSIVQSNAKGFILQLDYTPADKDNVALLTPDRVFVKYVNAADYVDTKKDWTDLRRTLLYARTEERFYANIWPLLRSKLAASRTSAQSHDYQNNNITPWCFVSESDLDGWIEPTERATDSPTATKAGASMELDNLPGDPSTKGGVLILEYLPPERYWQASPLTMDQCRQCLQAVAHLHAAAWQDGALLQRAHQELSAASFHLKTRNPKELASITETWRGFTQAFAQELTAAGLLSMDDDGHQDSLSDSHNRIAHLGSRLGAVAAYVSQEVSPSPHDSYATLIHGDYKSMNVFLPVDTDHNDSAKLVDFASCGVGLGMSDVAMHVHHAVLPEHLANGGEEALVRYYWQCLQDFLATSEAQPPPPQHQQMYPWDVAWRHYKLAVVDYGRFFVARMWKNATPATMRKKKDNANVNLINRSPAAAMAFIERLDRYLSEIEAEMASETTTRTPLGSTLSATMLSKSVLYGLRHAHSKANELMDQPANKWGAPTFRDDPSLIDADLSTKGIYQVDALAKWFTTTAERDGDDITPHSLIDHVDLVVVSPLTRCLQTWEKGCRNAFVEALPPVVAHPLATERVYTSSDTGRSIEELRENFPNVDFSLCSTYANERGGKWWYHLTENNGVVQESNEPEWRPHGQGQFYAVAGEPAHIFDQRMKKLRTWLLNHPAKCILLISHWGVLRSLSRIDTENCQIIKMEFETCE